MRRLIKEVNRAAEELKEQQLVLLHDSISMHDALDGLDDAELQTLLAMCGGPKAILTADDLLEHVWALGLRLGRMFKEDDVRDVMETLRRIANTLTRPDPSPTPDPPCP